MAVTQLIYTSQPFGFDTAILNNILLDARRLNDRVGITGALVCRRDIYLQCLEGNDGAVRNTMDRIRADDRHVDVVVRHLAPAPERLFADWAMLHDPAHTWTWTEAELADGALDRAHPADFLAIFERLSHQQAQAS